MRLVTFFCLFCALAGAAFAQDTNFPVGPQYLMTSGSPLFARPIATPSLSLGESQPMSPAFSTETASTEPAAPVLSTQPQLDLSRIFWGSREASENASVIEISSTEPVRPLPTSIVDVGVTRMTDAASLRESGFGVPLGDVSGFWKTHKPHATHVFTNSDIARLHGQ